MEASGAGPEAAQPPSWLLPGMAWQVVRNHLSHEDLLAGRLVCSGWRRDLGAFVSHATAIPSQLLLDTASNEEHGSAESSSSSSSSMLDKPLSAAAGPDTATAAAAGQENKHTVQQQVSRMLHAFPHCTYTVATSTGRQQQLAHIVINTITNPAGSSSGQGSSQSRSSSSSDKSPLPPSIKPRPQLCLDAIQHSYHCSARQEHPASTGRAPQLWLFLAQLPRQLSPAGLAGLGSLQLDAFPDAPEQWAVLQGLPQLTELVLPAFRPALSYDHVPHLADLTQLKSLTLSVQGSFTAWRASCAAFASLGRLTGLAQLCLHAFHAAGSHLASALAAMTQLSVLRLSGRIVLDPLAVLEGLTQLRVLELTQDVQYSVLCDLVHQLPGLTQLAVGRVTLPPAAPATAGIVAPPPAANAAAAAGAFPGNVWQPAPADAAAPAADAVLAAHAPPAAAEAAAVVVAADGGGAAAAAGAFGEVMLEDVGAIVDGLISNLQDGAVPVHLQRIIERFESIIQLDLTRRAATSPWGWPVPGAAQLQELGGLQQPRAGASASTAAGGGGCRSAQGCSSLELALLRPADVVRLDELPEQLRMCQHLGLRLRDQLLAFASVCPVRLSAGQLASLGAAFPHLASLTLCGKVALDAGALLELTRSLQPCGLVCLSLDCHFVSVPCGSMAAALQQLPGLKVLSLRHRGGGKLPLPVAALPASLNTLAVKKVLLFHSSGSSSSSSPLMSEGRQEQAQQQQLILPAEDSLFQCHAITSPGFRSAVASGSISAAPSIADLAGLSSPNSGGGSAASSSSGNGRESPSCSIHFEAAPGAVAEEAAAASTSCSCQALLPNLQSLFLKNCLVAPDALYALLGPSAVPSGAPLADCSSGNCSRSSQLTRLSVTGDYASHGEVAEGWSTWLQLLKQLKALQVLDLTVPENAGGSLPSQLLDALLCLPRLSHLRLTTLHQPSQLLCLTRLSGLRTISLNYTGPPVLPSKLLGALQDGMGPNCKVQLWEMLSMPHVDSFGETNTGGVGAGGLEDNGVRRQHSGRGLRRLAALAGWGAVLIGGWWCGWTLGGSLEQRRLKKQATGK